MRPWGLLFVTRATAPTELLLKETEGFFNVLSVGVMLFDFTRCERQIIRSPVAAPVFDDQGQALGSAGDVKRFLAWCIHSGREQSLDPKTAAIMGQLGSFLLKAVEMSDLEQRLADIEARLGDKVQAPIRNVVATDTQED